MSLSRFIWSVADLLCDGFTQSRRGEVVPLFTLLCRVGCFHA